MRNVFLKVATMFFVIVCFSTLTYATDNNNTRENIANPNGFAINMMSSTVTGMVELEETEGEYKLIPEYMEGMLYTYQSNKPNIADIDGNGNIEVKEMGMVTFLITRTAQGTPYKETEEIRLNIGTEHKMMPSVVGSSRDNMIMLLEGMFAIGVVAFATMYIAYGVLVYKNHKDKKLLNEEYEKAKLNIA